MSANRGAPERVRNGRHEDLERLCLDTPATPARAQLSSRRCIEAIRVRAGAGCIALKPRQISRSVSISDSEPRIQIMGSETDQLGIASLWLKRCPRLWARYNRMATPACPKTCPREDNYESAASSREGRCGVSGPCNRACHVASARRPTRIRRQPGHQASEITLKAQR